MKLKVSGFSECGPHRRENEDFILCNESEKLFVVADGLGGLPEGRFASSEAARVFAREFYPAVDTPNNVPSRLERALDTANKVLFAQSQARKIRFGTTLTAAHFWNGFVNYIHVGDTALWRIDDSATSIERLTKDDTLEREYIGKGQPPILASQYRNVLTQAVGLTSHLTPQIGTVEIHQRELFILSSDGFIGCVDPNEILQAAGSCAQVVSLANKLRRLAAERQPRDNFSAIFIKIGRP
jgi:serine/threonine protein phosphatase PrpC